MTESPNIPELSEEELVALRSDASAYLHRWLQQAARENLQAHREDSVTLLESLIARVGAATPKFSPEALNRVVNQ